MNAEDFVALPQMVSDWADDIDTDEGGPGFEELHAGFRFMEKMRRAMAELAVALEGKMLSRVEQAPKMTDDGRVYALDNDYKDRPEQDVIDAHFVHWMEKQFDIPQETAYKIIRVLLHDTYVSPSTLPKATGLKTIGLSRGKALRSEFTRKKLTIVDHGPARDEDA